MQSTLGGMALTGDCFAVSAAVGKWRSVHSSRDVSNLAQANAALK
jgi:hypothetical protein